MCDRLVLLAAGRVHAQGTPEEVLTPEILAEVFRVRARITHDPDTGKLAVAVLGTVPGTPPA